MVVGADESWPVPVRADSAPVLHISGISGRQARVIRLGEARQTANVLVQVQVLPRKKDARGSSHVPRVCSGRKGAAHAFHSYR